MADDSIATETDEGARGVLRLGADELLAYIHRVMPPTETLGLVIEQLEPNALTLRLPFQSSFLRPGNSISGPTLMMLADTAAFLMVLARIGEQAMAVTSQLNISFLRRARPAPVIARCRLLKVGRRLAVCDVDLLSEGVGAPAAHAVVTYAIPGTGDGSSVGAGSADD